MYGSSYMFRYDIAILRGVPSAFWDGQLFISQKALGTLPEDGNIMLKHVGATTYD
jgi:hypothetical protein